MQTEKRKLIDAEKVVIDKKETQYSNGLYVRAFGTAFEEPVPLDCFIVAKSEEENEKGIHVLFNIYDMVRMCKEAGSLKKLIEVAASEI